MQIFVRTSDEQTIPLEMELSDTIATVKEKIESRQGCSLDHHTLTLAEKSLDDDWTLADYQIQAECTLILLENVNCGVEVSIKQPDGRTTKLLMNLSSTIADVKQQLEDDEGIPRDHQQLVYNEQILDDDRPIDCTELSCGPTLYLIPRLPIEIELWITSNNGKKITLMAKTSDTIETVKAKIEEKEGIPSSQQRLMWDGQHLVNNQTLEDYKIFRTMEFYLEYPLEAIRINIESSLYKTIRLLYSRDVTISKLKDIIQKQSGYSRTQQKLVFAGQNVESFRTLRMCGIQSGGILQLELRCGAVFPIYVRQEGREVIELEVKSNETIANVKEKIQDEIGYSTEQQRLSLDGMKLDDGRILADYNIQADSIIKLQSRQLIQIHVSYQRPHEKRFQVVIDRHDTVADLKSAITAELGITAVKQQLRFCGVILRNERRLAQSMIENGSVLQLDFPLEIFVKISSGGTHHFWVRSYSTIQMVKERISIRENIAVKDQLLFVDGKELVDEKTLSYYNINRLNTIDLFTRNQIDQILLHQSNLVASPSVTSTSSSSCEESTIDHRVCDIAQEPNEILMPIEGYEKKPLVSLEEAIVPLIPLVPDVQRKAWIAKTTSKNPQDGLTEDESASIRLYSMEWPEMEDSLYYILNSTLRAQERKLLKPWFLYLKLILTGLSKLPSMNRTFYRGVKKNLSELYRPGKTVIWWSFSSCTSKLDVLQKETFLGRMGMRTLFTIECKTAKDVSHHSMFINESEVLLMPATQFEVIGQYQPCDDVYMIQLKETEPLYPLRQPV